MNREAKALIVIVGSVILFIGFGLWAVPTYSVWQQGKSGEAMLKKAEQEKQIMIETARAEVESATLQAEAISIVGQAVKEFPEYREQQFLQMFGEAIKDGDVKMIFVPTEANVPIIMHSDK